MPTVNIEGVGKVKIDATLGTPAFDTAVDEIRGMHGGFAKPKGSTPAQRSKGPAPTPLSEAAIPPNEPTGVRSNREMAAGMAEGAIDIGSTLVPGVGAMKLAQRAATMGLVGLASGTAKEGIRQALGLPANPEAGRDIVFHAGLNAGMELGGSLASKGLGAVPKVYRWAREHLPGAEGFRIALADKEAKKVAQRELLKTAEDFHLTGLSVGQVTGSKAIRGVEKFGERGFAGMILPNYKEQLVGEVANASNDMLEQLGKFAGQPAAGTSMKKLIEATGTRVEKIFDKSMQRIDSMLGNKPIVNFQDDAKAAIAELNKHRTEIEKAGGVGLIPKSARRQTMEATFDNTLTIKGQQVPEEMKAKILAMSKDLQTGMGPISFAAARTLRSNLLQQIRKLPDTDRDVLPLAKTLVKVIDTSMEKAAKTAGQIPGKEGVYELWREQNDIYRSWRGKIEKGIIGKMVEAAPEDMAKLVKPDDFSAMGEVKDAIFSYGASKARAQNRWDGFRRAWVQNQLKGAQEASGGEPAEVMAKQLFRLDNTFKGEGATVAKTYFNDPAGTAYVKNVSRVTDVMRATNDKTGAASDSVRSWYVVHALVMAAAGAAGGGRGMAGGLGTAAAVEVAPAILARVLHSKRATDYFVKGLSEAFPTAGAIGRQLKPSAVANVMRAVNLSLEEGAIPAPQWYEDAGVRPAPLKGPNQ